MPPPASRIFAFAPIEDRFDAPADAACSLRHLRPKRLKHIRYHPNIDRIRYHPNIDRAHRKVAKRWGDMSGERICPLLMMLGMTPACRVSLDIGGSAVIECHCARSFDFFLSALGLTVFDWIDLVGQQQSLLGGFFCASASPTFASRPSPISRALPQSM